MCYDPAPLAWYQHNYPHNGCRNTSNYCGCGYDDSAQSHRHCGCGYDDSAKSHRHRHKYVRPHVEHSPRTNTSVTGSIPATSSRTRRINRTTIAAIQDRDWHEAQQSSCPQPYGRALRTVGVGRGIRLARIDHLFTGSQSMGLPPAAEAVGEEAVHERSRAPATMGITGCSSSAAGGYPHAAESGESCSPAARIRAAASVAALLVMGCEVGMRRERPTSASRPQSDTTIVTLSKLIISVPIVSDV